MKGKRLAAPLVALMVVLAAALAVPTVLDAGGQDDLADDLELVGDADAVIPLVVAGAAVVGGTAAGFVGGWIASSGATEAELTKADAAETEVEIYKRGSTLAQDQDTIFTSFDNHLTDTETIARMEGKNAMIRALNNGSSKSAAIVEAKAAVADYYAGRQGTLLASWNTTVATLKNMRLTAQNTSGIDSGSGFSNFVDTENMYHNPDPDDDVAVRIQDGGTYSLQSVTLTNSSTRQHLTIPLEMLMYDGGMAKYNDDTTDGPKQATILSGAVSISDTDGSGNNYGTATASVINITKPDSNYNDLTLIKFSQFSTRWTDVQNQNSQIQSEMQTFGDNIYSSYVAGDINGSELIDPYLSARDYAPENDTTVFTLRSLTAMGIKPPENIGNAPSMNVTDGAANTNHTDVVLLSDGLPTGDQFEVGVQYDAANLAGYQGLMDQSNGQLTELEGNFTITSIVDQGAQVQNLTYANPTYNATSTAEYQELQDQLANLSAELNAYQDNLRSSGGGGGWFDFGMGGLGTIVVIGIVAMLAIMIAKPE